MNRSIPLVLLLGAVSAASCATSGGPEVASEGPLDTYLEARSSEAALIDPARRARLDELATEVARGADRLVFVCTHNSRRSQMAQIWACVAARHFGFAGVETYSGGTEATAFNPRTIAAIERAGLAIDVEEPGSSNPVVTVTNPIGGGSQTCFSKV